MIIFLAFIYIFSAFVYFYTNMAGYSFLRYIWKKKNINIYLATEIFYLILTSFVVFTSNPLNWMVAILMLLHLLGIAWLVASPNSFYQMAEESITLDSALVENMVVIMFLIYAGIALFSRILI
jgi:hypothetical protein